ncbi:MAG: cytochrome P450 [Aeromicrobium sp.]|uniref:cytochrome P450 n=1 Tax=Aeromicrobium sp. TaxID=1871063 RepID=UPI0039E61ED9
MDILTSATSPRTTTAAWTEEPGRRAGWPGAEWASWALGHGIARAGLRVGVRRGDPFARLEMDPELRADPYPGYESLRHTGVIVRGQVVSGTVSHAACTEILRSTAFGVADGGAPMPPAWRRLRRSLMRVDQYGPLDPPSMLAVDPPLHTRYRRLVSHDFAVKSVAALEDRVRGVARRLLDEIEGRGSVDLVGEYAARLPVVIIGDLLGVPAKQHDDLLRWGDDAARLLDPTMSWREYRRVVAGVGQLHAWFDGHVERLRRESEDNLMSRLVDLEGEDALTTHELRAMGLLLLGAGFETTVNLIGNAVGLLFEHPDQRAVLREDPSRWATAVDEALRMESPVQLTVRQAYEDTQVQGEPVRAGTTMLVMLAGANRDPEVFADPARFDVTRANAGQHLAFSSGAHFCPGAGLARLEGRVALEELFARFPGLRPDGVARRRPNRVLRGWQYLPVAV